jgi:hypothetical protein
LTYDTLAICRTLAVARAAFAVAIEESSRTRLVKRHPERDW